MAHVQFDSFAPDYEDNCTSCGQSPTVTAQLKGKTIHRWHLCGPCCFGTARALDPDTWDEEEEQDEMLNTIQAMWQSYEARVIPKDAGKVQRSETRRAFYAGAQALLSLQLNMPDELSEQAELAMIKGWDDELQSFAEQVLKGAA